MKITPVILIIFFIALCAIQSCLYDKNGPKPYNFCDTTYYYNTIRPIIMTNCAISDCHDGSNSSIGNYNFFADVKVRLENNLIQTRINLPTSDSQHMPQGKELSSTDFARLTNWISSGYAGCDLEGN